MDERSTHDEDDFQEGDDADYENTEVDEGDATPADTDDESDEPKTPAQKEKERQKGKWLAAIKSGDKTLDEMPENLNWLRKEIEPELKGKKPAAKTDELDERVQQALRKERDKEDLGLLIDDLEENATPEQLAQFKEEYDQLISDGATPLRATITSRRLIGLKDNRTAISERRRKGMMLPPNGSRRRQTVEGDKMTDVEKRLSGGLPPGYKA